MRVLILGAALVLLGGCAGPSTFYFPPTDEPPTGTYRVPIRAIPHVRNLVCDAPVEVVPAWDESQRDTELYFNFHDNKPGLRLPVIRRI